MTIVGKTKAPNIAGQFLELVDEFEGCQWKNVYFSPDEPVVYSVRSYANRADALKQSQKAISKLREARANGFGSVKFGDGTVLKVTCSHVIQIPIMGENR